MNSERVLHKYLSRYAETEAGYLADFNQDGYERALVIPAYSENCQFLQRLQATDFNTRYLLILISNHPDNLTEEQRREAHERHRQLQEWLAPAVWCSENLSLHRQANLDALLVNRTGANAIPQRQGVGLARKIGADLALALFVRRLLSSPWVHSSDADALLPPEYFQALNSETHASAITYTFCHQAPDNNLGAATALYERSINHYVAGLKAAKSPYAFHSVGSALAFNLYAYARARGFPRRSGGEDFYLLNKLAKLGPVRCIAEPIIEIEARASGRVPFGTGPAVTRLLQSSRMVDEPIFYAPAIFAQLELLIAAFNSPNVETMRAALLQLPNRVQAALHHLGVETALAHAQKQGLAEQRLQRHIHGWFDGFRTLRFVHLLRDSGFPSIGWNTLAN